MTVQGFRTMLSKTKKQNKTKQQKKQTNKQTKKKRQNFKFKI